jgi:antagonist of KipI
MSLSVIKPGIWDTIQDNGRHGYGKWGINPSGSMDQYASQTANALVGNELTEGVIEIHFPSGRYLFQEEALISMCGADFLPAINGNPIPVWATVSVPKNSILSFGKNRWGTRCYLAIHGGFDLAGWLGSLSTNVKALAGGLNGGILKKDDLLVVRKGTYDPMKLRGDRAVFPWQANSQPVYKESETIFFLEGNEWPWLTRASQELIQSAKMSIHSSSDRMASYLQHSPLEFVKREELLSSGVNFGTIQALPSGKLVVLMADHQTTGGYPRIGHIITAHLPKFSQLRPGQNFQFQRTSMEAAEKMLLSLQHDLQTLQKACREKLNHRYAQH